MDETKAAVKHFSKLGFLFLIGAVLIEGLQRGVSFLVNWLKPEWLDNPNMVLTLSLLPMYLIGIPILILLVKRVPATTVESHSMKGWHYALAVIMSFSVMYISNIVGLCITFLISLFKGSMVGNVVQDITAGTSLPLCFLWMVICAPIMEEFIFRKLIVDRTVRYGQGVAIVVSGLMFGFFHGNLNQFMYAVTIGMFLAFLYVKTGKLKYTIGIHMIMNFFGGVFSTWLLKQVNYYEYLAALEAGVSEAELTNLVMESMGGWLLLFGYCVVLMGVVVAGVVLFIVFRKRFVLEKGEVQIPKGKRFSTVWLNPGMILFSIYWVGAIIVQLFG